MNNALQKFTVALLGACLLTMGVYSVPATASTADAARVSGPTLRLLVATHSVEQLKIVHAVPRAAGHLEVSFNNGAKWIVAPCKEEDGSRCYWDAGNRGNGIGHSFVRLYHRYFYLN